MIKFFSILKGDLRLLSRYQIITVALIIAAFYILVFKSLPANQFDLYFIFVIFSDPSAMGFLFIGAMVLFEKDEHTLEALIVTPKARKLYVLSKTFSLTLVDLACAWIIAIFIYGFNFNQPLFVLSVLLSSFFYILIGFAGVVRVKTFNQYLLVIPLFLVPLFLPLLNFFEIVNWPVLYLIPTQAALVLFTASFETMETYKVMLALIYMILWNVLAFKLALWSYEKHLIK